MLDPAAGCVDSPVGDGDGPEAVQHDGGVWRAAGATFYSGDFPMLDNMVLAHYFVHPNERFTLDTGKDSIGGQTKTTEG